MRPPRERLVRVPAEIGDVELLPALERLYREALRKAPGQTLALGEWLRATLAELDIEEPAPEQTAAIIETLRWAEAGEPQGLLPC